MAVKTIMLNLQNAFSSDPSENCSNHLYQPSEQDAVLKPYPHPNHVQGIRVFCKVSQHYTLVRATEPRLGWSSKTQAEIAMRTSNCEPAAASCSIAENPSPRDEVD